MASELSSPFSRPCSGDLKVGPLQKLPVPDAVCTSSVVRVRPLLRILNTDLTLHLTRHSQTSRCHLTPHYRSQQERSHFCFINTLAHYCAVLAGPRVRVRNPKKKSFILNSEHEKEREKKKTKEKTTYQTHISSPFLCI